MVKMIEYECPCCGGIVAFDSASQKLKCPYCDTEFDMDALQGYAEDKKTIEEDALNWEKLAGTTWTEEEKDGMQVYICQSCGGEIVCDKTTVATKCPYCENNVVIKGKLEGDLRPDYVIPFKLDKKAAKEGLKRHLEGKKLLPKIFKDENHIDEIKGVYVPFWLFDAKANGTARYKAARVRTWSDSKYRYKETSFFSVVRAGEMGFSKVPVDGSTKMEDTLMESLEPFDFTEAVDFQTAYLAGYLADRYDVNAEESIARANDRIRQSTENALASTVMGYTTVIPESTSMKFTDSEVKYALYPVWLLNTTWKGKQYTFAMNGQTGKFVGDLPVDWGAYWKWFGVISAGTTMVVFLMSYLLWLI